jgi:ribosomal-protein-alanine N-acetyltransferase
MHEDVQIRTDRLLVIACPAAVADALARDRPAAEQLLEVRVPDDWPDAELAELLPLYAENLRHDPRALGFGVWLVVEQESRALIGSAGFLGLPDAEGTVEIGYGVHPGYRNRGYATEAVRALVAWALDQKEVVRVTARCDPTNVPSMRVAAKTGMRRAGQRKGLSVWITP